MKSIRAIIGKNNKVLYGEVALIFHSQENIQLVGEEGANVLHEAIKHQPDLLMYELNSMDDTEFGVVKNIYDTCRWTRVLLYHAHALKLDKLRRFLIVSHGYVQGPVLPSQLLNLVEMACYSECFFYISPL